MSNAEKIDLETAEDQDNHDGISRRKFLRSTALLGVAGTGLATVLSSCEQGDQDQGAQSPAASGAKSGQLSAEVEPGQLDEYYSLSSGGHSAEIRIYGIPSGR